MKSFDIVGYVFNADIICPRCLRYMAASINEQHGKAAEYVPLETLLNNWADIIGIDRMDEYTFDSDEFPKVIFADSADNDQCGECGELLL